MKPFVSALLATRISELSSISVSVAGYASIAGYFAVALADPMAHADFIFRTGLLIFVFEFLSIHSAGMTGGFARPVAAPGGFLPQPGEVTRPRVPWRVAGRAFLLLIYAAFAVAFGAGTGTYALPAIFLTGTAAKFFGRRASHRPNLTAPLTILLLFSVLLVAVTSAFWVAQFPFPPELFSHKLPNSSGLFVDQPQTLLVWGIIYYSIAGFLEAFFFWAERMRGKRPPSFADSAASNGGIAHATMA